MPELRVDDHADRESLGAFVARAVRLDGRAVVRLRERSANALEAWVSTPFDVLATRTLSGRVVPKDITVSGSELLAALTVATGDRMDPGLAQDLMWQSELPIGNGWHLVDEVPATVVSELTEQGLALAKENQGPQGTPPASLMDQTVLTVAGGDREIKVQLRCLFAMSGMGFLGTTPAEDVVKVVATDSWLRLDGRYGAVLRRRQALIPLLL